MKAPLYRALWVPLRGVFIVAARLLVVGREHVADARFRRDLPFVLAITHLSHNDPVPVSVAMPRQVDYMVRIESFSTWWGRSFMRGMGAFPVDRFGSALPAAREALRRLERGAVVGMFPEGEVVAGSASVLNGGTIKLGAAWLARRARVPIVPCVVLGSRCLSSPISWLPLKRARMWVAFGPPIEPNLHVTSSREGRQELGVALAAAFVELHAKLGEQFKIQEPTCNR